MASNLSTPQRVLDAPKPRTVPADHTMTYRRRRVLERRAARAAR
jgi:hypothetical protein